MNFRRATEADIPAEREVFVAALGELMRLHGFPASDPPLDRFEAIQLHLLERDGERCFVAKEEGRVARRGLVPATPVLGLAGEPRADAPPALEATQPDANAFRGLDRAAYGFERGSTTASGGRAPRERSGFGRASPPRTRT